MEPDGNRSASPTCHVSTPLPVLLMVRVWLVTASGCWVADSDPGPTSICGSSSSPTAWVTAANTSSRPSPYMLLFSGVPPQVRSFTSTAVRSSSARVAVRSPVSSGTADHSSATAPATCGEAIEVPLFEM